MVSQPLDVKRLAQASSLPSTADLPCSDDTPVDNEDQNLLPNLLLLSLATLWAERMDWFFAVDMAVYHTTGISPKVPVVPDAFLSLGVERRKQGKSRRSYATWEEGDVSPILAIEMVSNRYNEEYEDKLDLYARLGVLYYLVYNPEYWQRHQHQPFEVYKLEGEAYRLQIGEPLWMEEVGLGIGRTRREIGGIEQEVLVWCDREGNPYPLPGEARAEAAELRVERDRAERLAEKLRSLGVDPTQI